MHSSLNRILVIVAMGFTIGCTLEINTTDLAAHNHIPIDIQTTSPLLTNTSSIPVQLVLGEEILDFHDLQIEVTGGTISNLSGSGRTLSFDLTPAQDGVIQVHIPSQVLTVLGGAGQKTFSSSSLQLTVDRTSPSSLISTTASDPTNLVAIPVTASFDEPVQGLTISDFQISGAGGAAITSFSGSGSLYHLTIMPLSSGTIYLSLPAGRASDLAGNLNYASNNFEITYVEPPLPVLTSVASATNNLASIPISVDFYGIAVTGLSTSSFDVTNGTISGLSGSGSSYSFNLVPSGDGVVSIRLPGGAVFNSVGIANLASNILSFNVDRTAPSLTLAGPNPSSGKNNTSFIWTVTYAGADTISLSSANVSLNGTATAGCVATVGGSGLIRTITVTGCTGDGSLQVSLPAGTASDSVGNLAAASGLSNSAIIDNTAPLLTLSGPTPSSGNQSTEFTWTATYQNADIVTLSSSDISLSGTATAGCLINVLGSGTSTRTIKVSGCSGNGSVAISVAAQTAKDAVGNASAAVGPSLSATVDNQGPTISIGSVSPTLGGPSATFRWPVDYTGADSITLNSSDVTLNGTATAGCSIHIVDPSGDNIHRTIEVSGCTNAGTLGVSIKSGSASDSVGNLALAAGPSGLATIDNANVTVVLASTALTNTNLSVIPVTVSFSVSVSDFVQGDLNITNATIGGFTGSGTTYSFNLSPSADGTVSVQIPAGAAHDGLGNGSLASNLLSFDVDRVKPTLVISSATPLSGNSSTSFVWTLTYTGASQINLVAGDIALGGTATTGCAVSVSGTGNTSRTVTVSSCTGDGSLDITVPAGSARDLAGNLTDAATSSQVTIDNTGPTLAFVGPSPAIGNSTSPFVWSITYTGANSISLSAADISLTTTGTVASCTSSVSASGNPRTITVSGCQGDGTVKINVAANTAQDSLGNQAAASTLAGAATVDNSPPVLTITGPTPAAGSSTESFVWSLSYASMNTITLSSSDISLVTTGTVNSCGVVVANSGNPRTVTVSGCLGDGSVKINVAANTAQDTAGNQVAANSTATAATIDNTGPGLTIAGPNPTVGNSSASFIWTVNFVGATTVNLSSVNLAGTNLAGCSAVVTGSGLLSRTVTVSGCTAASGVVGIRVLSGAALDAYGNASPDTLSSTATIDNTPPALAVSSPTPSMGNSTTTFEWMVTYTGADTISLAASHVTLVGAIQGCTKSVSVVDATTRKISVANCTGDGSLSLSIAANTAQDSAGNQAPTATGSAVTVDNSPPTLAISSPSPAFAKSSTSIVWTLTYTDAAVVTLSNSDITLVTTGTVASCTKAVGGSGNVRTVTVTGCTGDGTVKFDVAANTAQDSFNNATVASSSNTATIDNTVPTLAITSPAANSEVTNPSSFVMSGTCNENGANLTFSPAATGAVLCSSSAWSATFNLSSISTATVEITATITDAAGNFSSAARTFQFKYGYKIKSFIYTKGNVYAGLTSGGSVVAWGDVNNGGTVPASVAVENAGIVSIVGNGSAIAALKPDGSVIAWGDTGSVSAPPASVTAANSKVAKIYSSKGAFAALKTNGSVVAWGDGNVPPTSVTNANSGVVKIIGTTGLNPGFMALKADGSVVSWGSGMTAAPSTVTSANSSVVDFLWTMSFSALKATGAVVGWGTNTPPASVTAAGSGVISVITNNYFMESFAALKADGTVVAWGNASNGGTAPASVTAAGSGVISLQYVTTAFAALKADGTVVAWGSGTGATAPASVTAAGSGVIKLFSNTSAFAALKYDGSVVVWGSASFGGSAPASVTAANSKVKNIVPIDTFGFAGIKVDGSVVTWGLMSYTLPTSVTAANSKVDQFVSMGFTGVVLKTDGSAVYLNTTADPVVTAKINLPKASVKDIFASGISFAALKSDGSVLGWGEPSFNPTPPASVSSADSGVRTITANTYGFAALKGDGTVASWGPPGVGGSAPASVTAAGSNVQQIFSTQRAFAALKADGSVVAWGHSDAGAVAPASVTTAGSGVKYIYSNTEVFAALKIDGSVVTWGNASIGGTAPASVTSANSGVKSLVGNIYSLSALKADGSVVSWGNSSYGGSAPASVTAANSGVAKLFPGLMAMAAVKGDGSVVVWGSATEGGVAPASVTAANSGVVDIVSNDGAFAALKADGTVVVWGNSTMGGDAAPTSVTAANSGVVKVVASHMAFAALKSDGSVVAWGDVSWGGDAPTSVTTANSDVASLIAGGVGFAALKSDGSVVCWGVPDAADNTPVSVTAPNSGVIKVVGNDGAFAAMKSDGSVISWGIPGYGNDSTGLPFKD